MTDNEKLKDYEEKLLADLEAGNVECIEPFETRDIILQQQETINRQKAEIERLNKELLEQKLKNNMLYETAKEIEIKAIKEFYDELTELAIICGSGVDEVWTLHAEKVRKIMKKMESKE